MFASMPLLPGPRVVPGPRQALDKNVGDDSSAGCPDSIPEDGFIKVFVLIIQSSSRIWQIGRDLKYSPVFVVIQ